MGVAMLTFGYMGESGAIDHVTGFAFGMCGWFYILYEIFNGEAGQVAQQVDKASPYVKSAFQTMRSIVTIGWAIYPLGYACGMLGGVGRDPIFETIGGESPLNFIYNIADFINKIAFCLAIWHAGKCDTLASGNGMGQPLRY